MNKPGEENESSCHDLNMNSTQIRQAFKEDRRFLGVFPSDKLPKLKHLVTKTGLIANLDPSSKPGSHWVAIFVTPRGGRKKTVMEYFDSYGLPPLVNDLLFAKNNYRVLYNKCRLQSYKTTTCGQFCIYFISQRLKNKSFAWILSELNSQDSPDEFVRKYVKYTYPHISSHKCRKKDDQQCCRDYCPNPPCASINLVNVLS